MVAVGKDIICPHCGKDATLSYHHKIELPHTLDCEHCGLYLIDEEEE